MFSKADRLKAVQLLIQYDMMYSKVIIELGYPNKMTLREWYREYIEFGDLHDKYNKRYKYSDEEKRNAVDYYLEHGKCIRRTCRKLGYPSRPLLEQWINELAPSEKKTCTSGGANLKYSSEIKENAVMDMCTRTSSVQEIADEYGVTRQALYKWKRAVLEGVNMPPVNKKTSKQVACSRDELIQENADLIKERDTLLKEVYRLQLEKDVLEKAAEIIKKDQGISLKTLTNREKTQVIDTLRNKYSLKELLSVFDMSKSSYCYQVNAINKPDKYEKHRELIRAAFAASNGTYGYRRIYLDIQDADMRLSEKVVRRIMKEENLIVKAVKKKKYNSYMGEISPAVDNIVNRDFHAGNPNEKWLTDITEFHIPAGKVYLSPIIDCFDGLPVAWTIGTHPDAELVNTMLDNAISTLNANEKPLVHSDRGAHYRWPGWIERMDNAGLTRSMSKKGCSPDNSACEGFFGRLKNEMFYERDWKNISIDEFIERLDTYIHWYAEKRRKLSLNGLSPIQYRKSLGLIA